MRIYNRKIFSIVLSLCMIVTTLSGVVAFAEDDSQPSVAGVYIEGAPILGETLTLNYVVNNPDDSLDELDDSVKWLKQGAKYYVRNSDPNNDLNADNLLQTGGLTFTIPDDPDLVGKYIAVWIPVDSIPNNGRMRTMGIGPIGARKTEDMIASSVTIVPGNDNGVGGDCGDILSAKFIAPDSEYTKQWYVSDSEAGNYTAITGATDTDYVIADDLYGKYIKFGITVGDDTFMSDNFVLVGNAAFGAFVYGNAGVGRCYAGCALNALTNGIMSDAGGAIYTYADAAGTIHENAYVIIDLGRLVTVSDILLRLGGTTGDHYTLQYSATGASDSWEYIVPSVPMEDTTNAYVTNGAGVSTSDFVGEYTARYIKVNFTHIRNTTFSEVIVMSKEDKAPTLTLEGDEEINLLLGEEYVEPGYYAEDIEDGDLTSYVDVTSNVNTDEIGEYEITYSVTDFAARPHTVTATRKVNVNNGFRKDGDLAFQKDVTISAGTNAEALVDGNGYTSWEVESGESSAVIDLGEEMLVSKIEINETGDSITEFELYGSTNGSRYSLLTSDDGVGDYVEDIDVANVRYLKLVVTSSDNEGAVNNFCAYFDDLGKVKYAADNIEIDANLNNVTEDLPLPDSGEFGTTIEWHSDNTSAVTHNGSVKRGTEDKDAVLTATVSLDDSSVTREFEVTVAKKRKTSTGGNGGGSSSVTIPYTPAVPQTPVVHPEVNNKAIFTDITKGHWAYDYVEYLYNLNLISGFEDGSFGAEKHLTRAQYLKMVMEALDLSAEGTVAFADVKADDWYYDYVVSAVNLGIVNGMGDGTFGANFPVSRQDMAVISAKALACANVVTTDGEAPVFADYADIAGYASDAVTMMSRAGIINGDSNGSFRPLNTATRAEAAKIVTLIHKLKGGN